MCRRADDHWLCLPWYIFSSFLVIYSTLALCKRLNKVINFSAWSYHFGGTPVAAYIEWYLCKKKKGKCATGHCYFLVFAKTHRLIVSLPGTIIILWHICQNTPHGHKRKVCYIFFKINHNMVIHQTFCFGPCNVFRQRHNRAVCFDKRQKITVSCSKFSLRKIAQLHILNAWLQQISRIWVGYVNRLNGMIVGLIWLMFCFMWELHALFFSLSYSFMI
jgi:hypothetical protein